MEGAEGLRYAEYARVPTGAGKGQAELDRGLVSQGEIQGIIELSYDKTGDTTDDYFLCFKDCMEDFQKGRACYPS